MHYRPVTFPMVQRYLLLSMAKTHMILKTPSQMLSALPSILLGTLCNVLDAGGSQLHVASILVANEEQVSTGLLVFPSDSKTFKTLQIQGMSMYLMRFV